MGFKINAKKRAVLFDCPHCASELRCPFEEAGTKQRCPNCERSFIVPGGSEVKELLASEHRAAEASRQEAEKKAQRESAERQRIDGPSSRKVETMHSPTLDDKALDSLLGQSDEAQAAAREVIEECANCGRKIGRLETVHVFKDNPVCAECFARLKPTVDYASPPSRGPSVAPAAEHALYDPRPQTLGLGRPCPSCGSLQPAVKKSKGSSLVLILLLLFWILPGLIYLIVYNGYVYVCPQCGFKYGDAT